MGSSTLRVHCATRKGSVLLGSNACRANVLFRQRVCLCCLKFRSRAQAAGAGAVLDGICWQTLEFEQLAQRLQAQQETRQHRVALRRCLLPDVV